LSGRNSSPLEEAEEIRLGAVLVLDHDRDVLEPARELRRQGVERAAHVLLEGQ
jgi:hypothetical protein